MKKIISLILIVFSSLFSLASLQAANNSDITKSNFTIDLSNMDPVNDNHDYDPSDYAGKGAALFLLDSLATLLLFLLPIIAGISFIVAGYYYVLSGGDSEKASQAKTIIKWNLIAIIIALFSYALVKMISAILSGGPL